MKGFVSFESCWKICTMLTSMLLPHNTHTHTQHSSPVIMQGMFIDFSWTYENLHESHPLCLPLLSICCVFVCVRSAWTGHVGCFLATNLFEVLPIYALTFCPLQFSLPSPQGGRDAITKNLILREDQLPQKFLYPKTKKKANKEVGFFASCSTFACIYLLACVQLIPG